jgi:hypothetical protein
MPDKVSPEQFSAKIKAKYPEYGDMNDLELARKIVDKYPEYKDVVDFGTAATVQPVQPMAQPQPSKYQKAVQDDRSELGKTLSAWWNGIVTGTVGETVRSIFDLAATYPTVPTSFGAPPSEEQVRAVQKFKEAPLKERLEISQKAVAPIERGIKKLRSTYTTEEEDKAMAGQFNLFDGIGLNDLQGLAAMSGRMAADMGIGALTGGTTFVLQGRQMAVEDYDEAVKKAGIEPNENARNLYGIAGGTINGLLEKFAIDKMFGDTPAFRAIQRKAIAETLKKTAGMTGKAAIDAIEAGAVSTIKKLTSDIKSKGVRAGYRALIEGGTESLQAGLEDAAKFAANAVQGDEAFNTEEIKKNFLSNIVNSGVAGGIFGPVFGAGADVAFGRNVNKELLNDIANAKTEQDIENIRQELNKTFDDNNFSQEERDIIMQNANRYAQVKQTLPEGTPASVQTVAIPKIEQRVKLDNEITNRKTAMESLDEAVKPAQEQEISLLEDKRASLNDEVREILTGDKFTYTEDNGKYYKQLGENPKEEISKNRYDLEQIKTEDYATTEGEKPIEEGSAEGDISQRQRTQKEGAQGASTKTDSRYRNISSEKAVGIPALLGSTVEYRLPGRKITGTLIQEGQTLSVEDENGDVVAEIGNVDELSNVSPEERNLTVVESKVESTDQGFKVDGKELFNENENPFDAVSVDQNGNVMNVVLTTAGGKRRKFRGRVAQDLAQQISAKEDSRIAEEDRQLQQRMALPTPQAPIVVTTEPAIAKVTEDNLDQVDTIEGTPLQKKVLADVKPVVRAIAAAVRNITGTRVSVNIHNQDTFGKAVQEAGGTEQEVAARGFYMASDGSIHLNMDNIDSDTMLHEGFHPILDILKKYNPQIINELFDQLSAIPEAAPIIQSARDNYEGDVTQKKEAITDFVAGVADGRIVLNPSNFEKIKAFILNMLNRIGLGQGSPSLMKVDNEQDLIKLANFITEKFKTGETITFEGLETIVGDDTADPVTVSNIAVVDPIQFQLVKKQDGVFKPLNIGWTPKGINMVIPSERSSLFDVVSKSGGAVVVINSDATGIGMKKGVLRQGGIGYTFIEQNIQDNIGFAASMDSKQTAFFKAVQEASRIRDEKFPDMAGKPVAVFVMVQAPEVMFGNAYGADYFIKSLAYALSHNEISTESAKADIVDYFNSIKETNDTGRKYANSIDALINLIQTSNLKSSKDRKKIYDLLITNRENNEDKSAKFGFDARRVLFGQFFNKVGSAKNKPGGRLRDILDNDGYNHKNFYNTFGDENVIKSLEGRTEGMKLGDGGFTMTGFFVDPTMSEQQFVERSKSGKFQHKQFNGKFYGTNPFVLNGKYYVNEVFPEARFVDKNGNPVPVTTSTAGSMYARTKTEPQAIVERAKGLSGIQAQRAPKTVTKKPTGTEAFLKEQFRFGLLGKEVMKFKEKMSGELSAEIATAEKLVKKAQEVLKTYGTAINRQDVLNFMTGQPTSTELPTDVADALSEMRGHVDGLTERLIQLGVIEDPETVEYYRQNKGEYLVRSYEAVTYKDNLLQRLGSKGLNVDNVAKKLKNVDKTVVDAALDFLAKRAMAGNSALTMEQAMKQARKEANDILSDAETYVFGKTLTGSTNVKSLAQRKDISPEIRALMGEYTDPLYNYYASIFKIASLTSSRQYLNSLKEFGMGKFLFTKEGRPEDANTMVAAEGTEALSPLNGLYTFQPVAEALQKAEKEKTNILLQAMGRIRKFKTVYNPATHVKNIIGNMGFVISNGHWNYLPESYKYIRALVTGKDDAEIRRVMDTLNRYSVLNNAVGVNELKSYFDRHDNVDDFLDNIYSNGKKKSVVSAVANAAGSVGKAMEKAYAIEDDVFKILAFVNESNRYAKAVYNKKYSELTDSEKADINERVAEIVKNTYPTFSRVPKFVRGLSKVAFLGNFLSFPAESIRVQYNSLKLALDEYNTGNPKLKTIGLTRMAGALAYNSLFSTLVYYSYGLAGAGLTGMLGYFGNDDEEENKKRSSIQKFLASWNKAKDVFVSQFKDGKLVYYDIGSLDSYSYQKTVWNEFWSNMNNEKGFTEAVSKAVAKGLDPWLEVDFAVKNMQALITNDDGRGGRVWNPEDTPEEIRKKQAMFVGKQFGPGVAGAMIRIADSYQKGESDKVKDELISQVFARKYTVDLKKQFMNYVYVDGTPKMEVGFKSRLDNAEKIYRDAKRQGLKGVELEQRYQDAVKQYKSILMTANEYYRAAIDGGVKSNELRRMVNKARMGRTAQMAITNGYMPDIDRLYIRK